MDKGLKRKLNTGLVLAFIAGLLFLFARPDYRQGEASLRGKPARNFALTLDGKPAHLSDLRGKVVSLNFWATWCPPCVEETPSLNQLQQRIAPLGGTVLGVSVDDDPQAYEDFPEDLQHHFPHLSRYHQTNPALLRHHHVSRNLRHRPQGRLDRKIIGAQDWTSPEMTAYINSLLNEK